MFSTPFCQFNNSNPSALTEIVKGPSAEILLLITKSFTQVVDSTAVVCFWGKAIYLKGRKPNSLIYTLREVTKVALSPCPEDALCLGAVLWSDSPRAGSVLC